MQIKSRFILSTHFVRTQNLEGARVCVRKRDSERKSKVCRCSVRYARHQLSVSDWRTGLGWRRVTWFGKLLRIWLINEKTYISRASRAQVRAAAHVAGRCASHCAAGIFYLLLPFKECRDYGRIAKNLGQRNSDRSRFRIFPFFSFFFNFFSSLFYFFTASGEASGGNKRRTILYANANSTRLFSSARGDKSKVTFTMKCSR